MTLPRNLRSVPAIMRSMGTPDLANSSGRIIRYHFSDASVGRDDHTIQGWTLDNFSRNPVFLWAHDGSEPPIGRVVDIDASGGALDGSVEYADADLNPFGDMIFRLVKAGYINATSTSWDPIDWRMSTDKNRPRGIDFKMVDLLEISQVPVPALATALVSARDSGIDTGPLYLWAERLLDGGGMIMVPRAELEALRRDAKKPAAPRRASAETKTLYVSRPVTNGAEIHDWMRGQGFTSGLAESDLHVTVAFSKDEVDWAGLTPRSDNISVSGGDRSVHPLGDKGAVVLRFASDDLTARWQEFRDAGASWDFESYKPHVSLTYAGGELDFADMEPFEGSLELGPERFAEVATNWETTIEEVDMTDKGTRTAVKIGRRGLYAIGCLADMLANLGWLAADAQWEADVEGDGSLVPAQILAVAKLAGQALVDMTAEEVGEFITMVSGDGAEEVIFEISDDSSRGAKFLVAMANAGRERKAALAASEATAARAAADEAASRLAIEGQNRRKRKAAALKRKLALVA